MKPNKNEAKATRAKPETGPGSKARTGSPAKPDATARIVFVVGLGFGWASMAGSGPKRRLGPIIETAGPVARPGTGLGSRPGNKDLGPRTKKIDRPAIMTCVGSGMDLIKG